MPRSNVAGTHTEWGGAVCTTRLRCHLRVPAQARSAYCDLARCLLPSPSPTILDAQPPTQIKDSALLLYATFTTLCQSSLTRDLTTFRTAALMLSQMRLFASRNFATCFPQHFHNLRNMWITDKWFPKGQKDRGHPQQKRCEV